ncbi:DUF721 domain-containing protein [Microlunatus flavus]|uniref:Predicted nucleic acid-binding protein, contains Zn-ribbon domain (Includes truncated derivatives) n=1 Tax=Microlunatus flavus TaxID=1036181 RepID=A0A1H9NQV5_9ACTN|nr:DciA family protein [Microlunatus flavus]SER38127.1 Predicted nucleic acid-binding protein, contains Zn-ribbon domain (includes truncated derivatives) [Microlunatus flavus]
MPDDETRPEPGTPAEEERTEAVPHDPTGLSLARETARAMGARARRRRPPPSVTRRSVDPVSSGAHPDDRDPQTLSRAVHRLVDAKGWAAEVNVRTLLARWALLVGPSLAEHSRPERYADNELTVRTDSTAWATQLRHMAPQLVAMLNEQLGADTVRFVRVLGPDAPSWKHGGRSVRDGRGPRDTYG